MKRKPYLQAGICPFCYMQVIAESNESQDAAKVLFAIAVRDHLDACKERKEG